MGEIVVGMNDRPSMHRTAKDGDFGLRIWRGSMWVCFSGKKLKPNLWYLLPVVLGRQ